MDILEKRQSNKIPVHGGDISAAVEEFGIQINSWIDLSTGINRDYYPKLDLDRTSLTNLPSKIRLEELVNSAKNYYQVQYDSELIAAPGTQSLLECLPSIFPNFNVAILSPTYSEHQYTWHKAGNTIIIADSIDKLIKGRIGVIVNPNNPDGRQHQVKDLVSIAKEMELLIIDEAFCDGIPDLSVIPYLENNNIIVLRSLGKFFGLAGLRLGFAIGKRKLIHALKERLGPWPVSGAAIEIGNRALSDRDWIQANIVNLTSKSSRLNNILKKKFRVIGNTQLFALIKTYQSCALYKTLGENGIFIRRFQDQREWLRIGLPGPENEWSRFQSALDLFSNTVNNVDK